MDISASLTKAQFATSGHKPTLVTDANAKQMNQAQVRKAAEDVEAFFHKHGLRNYVLWH